MLRSKFLFVLLVMMAMPLYMSKVNAQIVNNSKFRPMTYDEMVKPILLYQKAFEQAERDFEDAFVKAINEMNKENFHLSLFYFDRCSRINKRFNYEIYNQKQLESYILSVKQKAKNTKSTTASTIEQNIILRNSYSIPLRHANNVNSDTIIELPPFAKISILEKNDKDVFMKIKYNNYVGYISKGWLNVK